MCVFGLCEYLICVCIWFVCDLICVCICFLLSNEERERERETERERERKRKRGERRIKKWQRKGKKECVRAHVGGGEESLYVFVCGWVCFCVRVRMCVRGGVCDKHAFSFMCVTCLIWYVWHDSFMCVAWLIHVCDMTHSCVWHDSFICVTWFIHVCDMTHLHVWHDAFMRVTRLIHMCDVTHSYVWHDVFICLSWLVHRCDMTHSYVWRDVFICVTWLIHTGSPINFIRKWWNPNESWHTYEWVMAHIWMSYVTPYQLYTKMMKSHSGLWDYEIAKSP